MNDVMQEEAVASPEVLDALRGIVMHVLRLSVPDSSLTPATNLYELGLESLNVVELLTEIETLYDVVIDVEDLTAELFTTFGSLAAFVQGKIDGKR